MNESRTRIENSADVRPLSFLMIGQSNMAGRGDIGDVPSMENPNCFVYRMTRWQRMSEPINIDRTLHAAFQPGISLAASFADSLEKHLELPIGLIPCALGGTSIAEWMPGGELFDNAVFTAKLAMRKSELSGIIWHQGEDDCRVFDGEYYKKAFFSFIYALRNELGKPHLPLVIGELGENISPKYGLGSAPKSFNILLSEIANELPNTALASSKGIPLREDGIHFSARGARIMGERYFEKYLSLIK